MNFKLKTLILVGTIVISQLLPLSVLASTETVGNYTWIYRTNGDTAEIYGYYAGLKGYVPSLSPKPIGEVYVPSTLGGKSVTSIGSRAFIDCDGLISVTLPNSVTNIGEYAFSGCRGLTRVLIPDGVKNLGNGAFQNCDGLTNVAIPSTMTNIGDSAFSGCSGLMSLSIPDNVTVIPSFAFLGCTELTQVSFGERLTSIQRSAFEACKSLASVSIPDSVTSIAYRAFAGCSSLTRVSIPVNVTNIGVNAFSDCSSLMSITVDNSNSHYSSINGLLLSKDERTLLYGVNGDVTIPESVTNISDYSFCDLRQLVSVTMPNNVSCIGSHAFSNCSGLENLNISTEVRDIGEYAFYGCSKLTHLAFPNGIINIGNGAFYGCHGLSDITIPGSVLSIGDTGNNGNIGPFFECDGLTNVVMLEGVANIGQNAFCGCTNLTSVIIPGSVTNIGSGAFAKCAMEHVTISSNVLFVSDSAFFMCNSLLSYNVATDNANYMSLNGLLLSKDGTKIISSSINGDVVIPEGVTSISTWPTFYYVENITSLTIPSSVTTISGDYLWTCCNLTSIVVSTDNAMYSSSLGNLLSKDGATLMAGVDGEIPEGVSSISPYAFCGRGLTSLSIPGSVKDIGASAFANCTNLNSVSFLGSSPSGMTQSKILNYANEIHISTKYANSFDGLFRDSADYGYNVSSNQDTLTIQKLLYSSSAKKSWCIDSSISHDGYESHRSSGISHDESTWLEVVVRGTGQISFWWKASSEEYDGDVFDYAYLSINGVPQGSLIDYKLQGIAIGGQTDWTNIVFDVIGDGPHTIRWTYCKDNIDEGTIGEDCIWLDEFSFTPKSIVAFNIGDANGDVPAPICGFTETRIILPSDSGFAWDNHVFDGWCDGDSVYAGGADYTVPSTNVALTAKWIAKSFISFDIGGVGNVPETIKEVPNAIVTLPTADNLEWVDHVFSGWCDGVNVYAGGVDYVVPSSNVTLTAYWLAKSFVSFDIGDGTGDVPETIKALPDETVSLPTGDGVSLTDYVFDGWTDGAVNYAAGADYAVPETNVTLKAIWIAKRFLTFTLDDGDGEIPITIKDVPNATVTLPSGEGFHRAKHAFVGWSDGTQTYDASAEYVVTDSSVEFTAVWAANSLVAPTISSADVMTGGTIETASATIEMTADSGTAIYYTLDGTEPTTNSIPYAAPFVADGMEVTIKAFAVKDDYFDSPVTEFAFSRKPYSAAECINAYGKAVSTGNDDTAWGRVLGDAALDGVAALRSGVIGEGGTSSVEMFVDGAGEIGFWWKASCERVIRGQPKDHVAFHVDGVSQCWMGGLSDWSNVVVSVSGEGSHVLKWVYQKDCNGKAENEDCAWLDEVIWTSMDSIPVIASDGELAAALTGTADANVSANVTNAVQYAAYRDWALSVTNGTTTAQMIKESTRTWLSYALGADALIGKEITSNDVWIVAFEAANADSGAMGSSRPTFAFEVAIDNVNIGGGSVAVETLKENLKKVLGIEGATTLSPGAFSSDNIDITFDAPVDGKARFTVSPPADAGNSFFMRVKVK